MILRKKTNVISKLDIVAGFTVNFRLSNGYRFSIIYAITWNYFQSSPSIGNLKHRF